MRKLFKGISIYPATNCVRMGLRKYRFGQLGDNIRLGGKSVFHRAQNIFVGSDVFIGADCYFEAVSKIVIGDGVMIGPRVFCISGSHNYDSPDLQAVPYDNRQIDLPITIGDNAWIAGNVSIAPGAVIGEGAVVGMGAVVAGNIPPCAVVVGGRGSIIKYRDIDRYERLAREERIYGKEFAGKPFEMMDRAK